MKRDIIAIHGSPRSGGFSRRLHESFLQPFRETDFHVHEISAGALSIHCCTACGACAREFRCIFDDDMTSLYPLLRDAAFISIATPVYFSGVPAQLKKLIDRCQVLWELNRRASGEIALKEVFLLAAAGSDYEGVFRGVYLTCRHFFNTIGGRLEDPDCLYLSDTDHLEKISGAVLDIARKRGREKAEALQKVD